MKLGAVRQQPAEVLSYTVRYQDALTAGDDITESTVVAEPTGELTIDRVVVLADRVRFWVSGGVSGKRYKVTITTETAESRRFQDELLFSIRDL